MFFSDHRIDAVSNLGAFLRSVASGAPAPEGLEDLAEALRAAATKSLRHNGWFTEANVYHALEAWGEALTKENLWRGATVKAVPGRSTATEWGVVMAGTFHWSGCMIS